VAVAPTGPLPTTDIDLGSAAARHGSVIRLLFSVLVLAIVVVGLSGWFGVRTHTRAVHRGGYRIEVEYTAISRRGLTSPLAITMSAAAGFAGDVTIVIPRRYLARFDVRAVSPQPDEETSRGDAIEWTFSQPSGTRFAVDVDTGVDPSAQPWTDRGSVRVEVDDRAIATVPITTWIWP